MSRKMYITVSAPTDDSLSPWNWDNDYVKENICMMPLKGYYNHYPKEMEKFLEFVDNMFYDFEDWEDALDNDRVSFKQFMADWGWKDLTNEELVQWQKALHETVGYDTSDEEFFTILLPLICGDEWGIYSSTGYSQGDNRVWFYRKDKYDKRELDILSDYYWGGYDELHIQVDDSDEELANGENEIPSCSEDYWDTISGREELDERIQDLMDEHDVDRENVRVFKQNGYIQVPRFEVYNF